MKKHFAAILLALCVLVCLMPAQNAHAAETAYSGSNVDAQNYKVWSSTVKSYLLPLSDNSMMRVQYVSGEKKVWIQYFDENYHVTSSRVLPEELPIFGGFYASDSNYYLVTGQGNSAESAEVEVYRITKYDKNWNRIGSAGLYDCNTTVPFNAGSCRMDLSGKYLIVHTCHTMYQAEDGYNHQANVTIQVDVEKMEITDSFTRVLNAYYGYVSHSFNQFVRIDGTNLVTVDHGDAYPRSLVLISYPADITEGTFQAGTCTVTPVLKFAGETGNNTTNASVGGFEISDNAYLVAGNSIDQDTGSGSRNVFVASVDKNSSAVQMNYLTKDGEEGSGGSTPHLVKISSNQFIILWSVGQEIFYAKIDGSGNLQGNIYQMEGNLSDCAPIAVNDKVVWYTWEQKELLFYEIDSSDLSKYNVIDTVNGHDYAITKIDEEGIATLECTICHDTITSQTYTSIKTYWNNFGEYSGYSRAIPKNLMEDTTLYFWNDDMTPEDAEDSIVVESSNPEVALYEKSENSSERGHFILQKPGKANITVKSKWNPNTIYTYSIVVGGKLTFGSLTVDKVSPQKVDSTITLTAEAFGGEGSLSYCFYLKDENGNKTILRDYDTKASFSWKIDAIGTGALCVDVKDSEGTVVSGSIEDYVLEKAETRLADTTKIVFEDNKTGISYGEKLSSLVFDKEKIKVVSEAGDEVKGSFAFDNPDVILDVGSHEVPWTFTPEKNVYLSCKGMVEISVEKAKVEVIAPTAETIVYAPNLTLADITLTDGEAGVPGSFAWAEETTKIEAGEHFYDVVFLPKDRQNYEERYESVKVTVEKASLTSLQEPKAQSIVYGQPLRDSELVGGEVVYDTTKIEGTYQWETESTVPKVKDSEVTRYAYTFIPYDTNYSNVSGTTLVTITPAQAPTENLEEEMHVVYEATVVGDVALPKGWNWAEEDADKALEENVYMQATALYEDQENYENTSAIISIYRESHVHQYGAWKTTKEATALAAGVKTRICTTCGEKEQGTLSKLKATMTLPTMVNNTVSMKVKQVNKNLKVTKMAKGDYVKSWKSSNSKIVKVSGTKAGAATLTAGTKTGTAKITITLASGKKSYVNVKVQKTTVKTTKITGLTSKISIKKNKTYSLKPVLVPFTTQQKATYKSSDTKRATVSSKGVITAKKAGKVYITVKSGTKSYKITVTIK